MTETKGTILVIHGPNLNMLGTREPEQYGRDTLAEIDRYIQEYARPRGLTAECRQSNSETEIVEIIQGAVGGGYRGLIINPAAYTHTSVAIRDAVLLLDIPVVEVHLSNIHKREPFRQKSLISDVATGTVAGFGKTGYVMALQALVVMIDDNDKV